MLGFQQNPGFDENTDDTALFSHVHPGALLHNFSFEILLQAARHASGSPLDVQPNISQQKVLS